MSIIFFAFLWVVGCVAVVILWTAAERNGMIDQVEQIGITFFALDEFNVNGSYLFKRFAVISGVFSVFAMMGTTLTCVVFNLISDLVGGIRLTVIEEESVRFRPPKRRVQGAPRR